MPLYEYQCTSCGQKNDVIHSMSEEPTVTCESCGGSCNKLVSSFSIHGTEASHTFEYNAVKSFREGQEERRQAQEASHMGKDPYNSIDSVDPDIVDHL